MSVTPSMTEIEYPESDGKPMLAESVLQQERLAREALQAELVRLRQAPQS